MRATEFLLEAGAVPIYYFAYGMLTDPKIMQGADLVGTAVLKNFSYEMLQYANVYPETGDQVIGVLWALDRNMLAELDRTEGYPQLYDRKTVPVYIDGNKVVAELYTMTPETRGYLEGTQPRKTYVTRIARGYRAAGVPIEQLINSLTSKKQGVAEGLNEFAPDGFNGGDDGNDLQLYLNVAKKLNMKKYKPSTAHNLIAKKMAELVDVVDDDKVDYARHMARKAQGLPSMLDQQGVAEAYKHYSNTKNPVDFPKTWHDIDKKLGKAVDKMSQAEKVKKGFAHPDTLKKKGVAEGAPELLKKEMPLHRHAEKLLAQNGVSKDDPDYHHHLGNTIKHLRQFGNIDLINKSDEQGVAEGWSSKYKKSINCSHPKGFSQKAHCAGKKKHNESAETPVMEMVCEDCGMCESHGNLNEIKKGAKDSNGYTKCWPGKHAEGTKTGKNGKQVRNCVPNESITEDDEDRGGGASGRVERSGNSGRDKYTKDPILNYKGLTPKIKDFIRRSYVTNPQSDNDLQATFGHMADMEKIMTDMSAELERIETRLNDGRRVMQQQDSQIRAIARQSSSPNDAPIRSALPIMARSNSAVGPETGYRLPAKAEQPAQESVQEDVADKFNVVVNDRIVGTYHVKDQAYAKQRELKQQDPSADVIVTPVFSEARVAKVSPNQGSFDFDGLPTVKPKSAGTSIFDMESDDIDSIPTKPTFNKQGKRVNTTNNFNKPALDYMYGESNVPPPRKIPMYFFKVGRGGRSFTDADLNTMGMRKSAKGAWYFKPTPEMTPQEILARVKELEIKTNVKAREWMPEQNNEVVAIQQNLEESWQIWINKGLRIKVNGI